MLWKAATMITIFLSLSHSVPDHGKLFPLSKTVSLPYPHNWENVFKYQTSRRAKDLLFPLNELYFLKYLEQYQMHQGKGLRDLRNSLFHFLILNTTKEPFLSMWISSYADMENLSQGYNFSINIT